jgi:hypothetical protein
MRIKYYTRRRVHSFINIIMVVTLQKTKRDYFLTTFFYLYLSLQRSFSLLNKEKVQNFLWPISEIMFLCDQVQPRSPSCPFNPTPQVACRSSGLHQRATLRPMTSSCSTGMTGCRSSSRDSLPSSSAPSRAWCLERPTRWWC